MPVQKRRLQSEREEKGEGSEKIKAEFPFKTEDEQRAPDPKRSWRHLVPAFRLPAPVWYPCGIQTVPAVGQLF